MDKKAAFEIASKFYHHLLDNKFAVKQAFLFGSYARGEAGN